MELERIINLVSAVAAFVVVAAAWFRESQSLVRWSFIGGMGSLALESACAIFIASDRASLDQVKQWAIFEISISAALPGSWLLFSLCYCRGNYRWFLQRWKFLLAAAFIIPLGLIGLLPDSLVAGVSQAADSSERLILLGRGGLALCLFRVFCWGLIAMNLERTFHSSAGTMRWRIKFMILGLGLLCAVRIYTGAQAILYSELTDTLQAINSCALLLSSLLICWSLLRTKRFSVDLYPSQTVLHHSLTVLLAGIYLCSVGLLAKIVIAFGGHAAFPMATFFVLVGVVTLGAALLSDRVRQHVRRFVAQHFHRPAFDYRRVWIAFSERTAPLTNRYDYCRAITKLISETFETLSVTVWAVDESQEHLTFAASTCLADAAATRVLDELGNVQDLIARLSARNAPFDLLTADPKDKSRLLQCGPSFFPTAGSRVCVPLSAGGQLLGLVLLGDRVRGRAFLLEDYDLLKCIADQIAANLLNLTLAEKVLRAKELEAFQTMSAFFVHDLKNTASTLSLMLQNMPRHFESVEFRKDALRAVGSAVEHLNGLIGRLGVLRQRLEIHPAVLDLNEVLNKVIESFDLSLKTKVIQELTPLPPILADSGQLANVIVNLLLNGKEALGQEGNITVRTSLQGAWVLVSVSDNGCGMSPEFLQHSLFRPFQTTKKNGLGIGMFQTKTIVEAHRGRIEVESSVGNGTTFRVYLPAHKQ